MTDIKDLLKQALSFMEEHGGGYGGDLMNAIRAQIDEPQTILLPVRVDTTEGQLLLYQTIPLIVGEMITITIPAVNGRLPDGIAVPMEKGEQ